MTKKTPSGYSMMNKQAEPNLTDRDYAMLEAIGRMGGLRATALSTLFFRKTPEDWLPIPHSNCQHHLKLLSAHGWLGRIEQPVRRSEGRKSFIYTLTKKGALLLADHLGCQLRELHWRRIDKDSTGLFLEHLMWMNEICVAILFALRHLPIETRLVTWIDDAELKRLHSHDRMTLRYPSERPDKEEIEEKNVVLIPDGYFRLSRTIDNRPASIHFFLEVDRGTESGTSSIHERRTWERKIRLYEAYFQKGGFYEQRYKTTSKRVLTVTTSQKRLAHLKKITEKVGGAGRFWFTTFDQIRPDLPKPTRTKDDPPLPAHVREEWKRQVQPFAMKIFHDPIWQKAGSDEHFTFFKE